MAGWFLLALFVGEIQLLTVLPGLAVPAIVGGLSFLLVGSYFCFESFRAGLDRVPEKALIAIHLTRFVGIYFLVLSSRGALEPAFAIPAGWGDLLVALGALGLLLFRAPRWLLLAWNCIGLADILFVVATAASLRLANPDALAPLTRLPLSFLPTMIVPLIIATHVILFRRLLQRAPASAPPEMARATVSVP